MRPVTTAPVGRALNRLGAIGETRLEGQRGYVGQRLDIGYPACWCGRMPAEHVTPHVTATVEDFTSAMSSDGLPEVGDAQMLTWSFTPRPSGWLSISDCCSECADTGTTFDDNDQPIPCPRCNT